MRFILIAAAALTIGAAPPSERVIRGDGSVAATVNGVPIRFKIDPGAVAVPMLTTASAQRAQLRAGPFDFEFLIGPRRVTGKSAVSRIDFGTGPVQRRIGWTDAPYIPGYEGSVGPGLLREKIVRFQLRPARPNETTTSLPLVGQGGIEEQWGQRFALISVGGYPMRVQFDPAHRRTVATANAAVRIAVANSGRMGAGVEQVEIAFGIQRPVRPMHLDRPLLVGPLAIRNMGVRTADFGSAAGIAEQDSVPSDPDEIVVVGKRNSQKKFDYIRIGSDYLDRCSSITFDKAAKQVRLTCLKSAA